MTHSPTTLLLDTPSFSQLAVQCSEYLNVTLNVSALKQVHEGEIMDGKLHLFLFVLGAYLWACLITHVHGCMGACANTHACT